MSTLAMIALACGQSPATAPTSAPSATGVASAFIPSPSAQVRADLTPPADIVKSGKLRVAFRAPDLLADKDGNTGKLIGLHPDIAAELARRLGVEMVPIEYPTIDAVLAGAQSGAYDVGFEVIDPTKTEVEFTNALVEFGLKCIVPAASPLRSVNDLDRPGVRIAVPRGSTPDRYLTQNFKQATIIRTDTRQQVSQLATNGGADAFPGPLASLNPVPRGFRLLEDDLVTIRSAMMLPKGKRADLYAYLRAFVEDVKASGLVKESVDRNKLLGVTIAPPGR